MAFELRFAPRAADALNGLENGPRSNPAKLKKVRRALALLQQNPRYPGLHSHPYESFPGLPKGKVWDCYVENHTPSAWRIFWQYGPDEVRDEVQTSIITVLAITPHP